MTINLNDLHDILDGLIDSGMGECGFSMAIPDRDFEKIYLNSVTIHKDSEGVLMPIFQGGINNA